MAFRLRAQASRLEIDLYDVIGADPLFGGGISAAQVLAELKTRPNAREIFVRINSAGGVVTEGWAIYNLLKQSTAKVTCRVDALAGSIASVIAMAGDVIEMAETSFMMIHEPYALTAGRASDHDEQADLLRSITGLMTNVYTARSGQSAARVREMMKAETWMTAREALSLGFCDHVIADSGAKIAACVDLAKFKNAPKGLHKMTAKLSRGEHHLAKVMRLPTAKIQEWKAEQRASGMEVATRNVRAEYRVAFPLISETDLDNMVAEFPDGFSYGDDNSAA